MFSRALLRRIAVLSNAVVVCVVSLAALGQEPAANSTTPGAVPPGATTNLQINGGNLALAKSLWTSFPCESILTAGIDKNGENPAQVTYTLNVPANTAWRKNSCALVAARIAESAKRT